MVTGEAINLANTSLQNIAGQINISAQQQAFEQAWAVMAPSLMQTFDPIITIFQTVGILFIIYLVFGIIGFIFKWNERKRLKTIEQKVNDIDKKLDELTKKKSKK